MNDMKRNYEGMFLVDAGAPDFETASAPVREVLDRAEAEVLALKPWDDRRLAYDIAGRKRGLYVLTYFKVAPANIGELKHDGRLNEQILRMLVLRKDRLTEEEIHAETPATSSRKTDRESSAGESKSKPAEQAAPAPASKSEKPAEQPAEAKAETPAEQPAAEQAETPSEKPAETAESPAAAEPASEGEGGEKTDTEQS